MIRSVVVFLVACVVGLIIQATFAHTIAPFAIAPDIVVILAVFLGLRYQNWLGAAGAFCLGVLGDFASAQFVGPVAGGSLVAFVVAVIVSRKVYAENPVAIVLLTFLCSVADSVYYMIIVGSYVELELVWLSTARGVAIEALITSIIAPAVISALEWGTQRTKVNPAATSRVKAYKYSARTR